MSLLTASLYLLCLAFLLGSAVFVCARDCHARLNRLYALLALALLGWVGTLFVFGSLPEGETLLLIGRANFAAAAVGATASFLFAAELAGRRPRLLAVIWPETLLLAALSLATPLIDRAETVLRGLHSTTYGPLFALYVVHIVGYLALAVAVAFRPPVRPGRETGTQLRLVGAGIFRCPSNPKNNLPGYSVSFANSPGQPDMNASYAAARYDGAGLGGPHGAFLDDPLSLDSVPVSLASLQTPASTVEVVESTSTFSEVDVTKRGYFDQCTDAGTFGCLFAGHAGRSNYLFCDGHVKALRPLQTVDTGEGGSGSVNMWTTDNSGFASPADQADAVRILSASTSYYGSP